MASGREGNLTTDGHGWARMAANAAWEDVARIRQPGVPGYRILATLADGIDGEV
jgi:hypothetical protein